MATDNSTRSLNEILPQVELILKQWVKEAFNELEEEGRLTSGPEGLKRTLAQINAKPYLTVAEAALLLNVSESHLYKQIKLTRDKKTKRPIPFHDIGGETCQRLPREALLLWARSADEDVETPAPGVS